LRLVRPVPPPGPRPAPAPAQRIYKNPLPKLAAKLDRVLAGRAWPGALREVMDVRRPVPLEVGISDRVGDALGLDDRERRRLGLVLRNWTASSRYLAAVAEPGAVRHGLDGTITGPVDPDHQQHALELLTERRARWRQS
jgi:sRNA-binding protein